MNADQLKSAVAMIKRWEKDLETLKACGLDSEANELAAKIEALRGKVTPKIDGVPLNGMWADTRNLSELIAGAGVKIAPCMKMDDKEAKEVKGVKMIGLPAGNWARLVSIDKRGVFSAVRTDRGVDGIIADLVAASKFLDTVQQMLATEIGFYGKIKAAQAAPVEEPVEEPSEAGE